MNHPIRSLFSPLLFLLAATAVVLGAGCGRSASQGGDTPGTISSTASVPEPAAQPAAEIEETARTEVLERRVRDLEAQLVPREVAPPVKRPSRAATPVPIPTPAPTRLEVEAPAAELPRQAAAPEPDPEPQKLLVRLEAGTELQLTLRDALSSETSQAGDPIFAVVAQDVVANGVVAVPAGSEVHGSVVEAVAQKKIGGQARLALRFEKIRTPDGYEVGIQSSTELLGQAQKKKDAATIGGAAAGGALLGRVLSKHSKSKGTLIGAAAGAAIGTAVASQNAGDPVVLESGATVTVQIDLPAHVAVAVVE